MKVKAARRKLVVLEVTTATLYAFEEGSINNWGVEQVIEDWFKRYSMDSSHATRDAYKVGASARVVSVKQLTEEEYFGR